MPAGHESTATAERTVDRSSDEVVTDSGNEVATDSGNEVATDSGGEVVTDSGDGSAVESYDGERSDVETMSAGGSESDGGPRAATTVTVRCTGHVRTELGTYEFEYAFAGDTLREFLDALFDEYPQLQDMLIAETEADATHGGWAPTPDELPGTWTKNPLGEQTIAYARILVNGRFNENEKGFDTTLEDGDRVALVYPFMFCC